MKKLLFTFLFVSGWSVVLAQYQLSDYFKLDIRYYHEGDERYLGVSPEIRQEAVDVLGMAMRKYPRRFRYILHNRSQFTNRYEPLYPDTLKINRLYINSLSSNKKFTLYFNQLAAPFVQAKPVKPTYRKTLLMKVASRFFYCTSVNKDSTINAQICINMNGVKNAFAADYTLLEAFCFEAIFERYQAVNGQPNRFVQNFKNYIRQGENKQKGWTDASKYLKHIREFCFAKMEKDAALQDILMAYYQLNRKNVPFVLIE